MSYVGRDEEEAKQELPEELVEDVKSAVNNLASFALFLKEAKGADIENSPIIQEIATEVQEDRDLDNVDDGSHAFRITIQKIPLEQMEKPIE